MNDILLEKIKQTHLCMSYKWKKINNEWFIMEKNSTNKFMYVI